MKALALQQSVFGREEGRQGSLVRLEVRPPAGRTFDWKLLLPLARIALPVAVVLLWELLSRLGAFNPRILPSPSAIFNAFLTLAESGILLESLQASLRRAGFGFLIGLGCGLLLGMAAGLWRSGEVALDATMHMKRMIPNLALIPLFIVWFGVGEEPKIILIAAACVSSVYVNTFAGVRNVDRKVVEAARVFGMSSVEIAWRIVLPLALPTILVGVRWSMGTAFLALVGAEQINAQSGLGFLAMTPRAILRTDITMAIVFIYAFIGVGLDMLVRLFQRLALPWHRTVVAAGRTA